jgi:hypothetical protein
VKEPEEAREPKEGMEIRARGFAMAAIHLLSLPPSWFFCFLYVPYYLYDPCQCYH